MTENQKKGLEKFCTNPYWKEIYDNAPSEMAKLYYAQHFAYSCELSKGKEDEETTIAIYRKLAPSDWNYIIENCHNNMGKWGLKKAREKYAAT